MTKSDGHTRLFLIFRNEEKIIALTEGGSSGKGWQHSMNLSTLQKIRNEIFYKNTFYTISNKGNTREFIYWKHIPEKEYNVLKALSPGKVEKSRTQYFKKSSLEELGETIQKRQSEIKSQALKCSLAVGLFSALFSLSFASIMAAAAMMLTLAFIARIIFIRYFEENNCFIGLAYLMNEQQEKSFEAMQRQIDNLFEADFLWHIDAVVENKNPRTYCGSGKQYQRTIARRPPRGNRFILSGIHTPGISYSDKTVKFFPDFILYKEGPVYSVLSYDSLSAAYKEKPFFETEFSPSDSRIAGHAWLHPNKNGTRDKRFKKNPRIPRMVYSEILISAGSDTTIHLQVSLKESGIAFARCIGAQGKHYSEERFTIKKKKTGSGSKTGYSQEEQDATAYHYDYRQWDKRASGKKREKGKKRHSNREYSSHVENRLDPVTRAYKTLGLPLTADQKEIKRAYLRLVKIYHPDKHAGRDKELMRKAEEKLKSINDAYEQLKHL